MTPQVLRAQKGMAGLQGQVSMEDPAYSAGAAKACHTRKGRTGTDILLGNARHVQDKAVITSMLF